MSNPPNCEIYGTDDYNDLSINEFNDGAYYEADTKAIVGFIIRHIKSWEKSGTLISTKCNGSGE